MAPRTFFRRMLRWACLFTLLTAVVNALLLLFCAWYIIFGHALPIRRAYHLETAYQRALYTRTARPVIEDVRQLYYWSFEDVPNLGEGILDVFAAQPKRKRQIKLWYEELGLQFDGTAQATCTACKKGNKKSSSETAVSMMGVCQDTEYWIYLAGSAQGQEHAGNDRTFSHRFKTHDCNDPPYICDMYREAFNRVSERWHATSNQVQAPENSANPALRWGDCDVSPLLCTALWGLGGNNFLVHMKVGVEGDHSVVDLDGNNVTRCPVTWRHVGLPLKTLPWSRPIRIPLDNGGSTVVPAFPSAEEQLWTIMAQSGAEQGLDYYDFWNSSASDPSGTTENTIEVHAADFDDENSFLLLAPLQLWGLFHSIINNTWDFIMKAQTEQWIKCNIGRWLDLLLRWWDDASDVVQPRLCAAEAKLKNMAIEREQREWEQLEKRHEQNEKLRDVWNNVMEKHGLNPDFIYDEKDETGHWARDLLGGLGAGFW